MSVIAVCGLPGSGKTLFTTYLMLKHYRKDNNIFKRIFMKNKLKSNVFSNYPIRFSKSNYCNIISLWDMDKFIKYPDGCDIVFDEFQLYFDSLDFKNFPKTLRNTFQLHRHFGINNIYLISQHPSRIVKQARVLCCEFYEIRKHLRIPLIGVSIFRYNIYYNFEDYGKPTNVKKSDVVYRFKKRMAFFRYKKVYKAYNTTYMKSLVENEPLIDNINFTDKNMSISQIYRTFRF